MFGAEIAELCPLITMRPNKFYPFLWFLAGCLFYALFVPENRRKKFDSDLFENIDTLPGYSWLSDKDLSFQGNIYLERYNLHYCKIDKNMGSAMQALLCYLDKPAQYYKFFTNSTWKAGLPGTDCGKSTSYGELRKRFMEAVPGLFDEGFHVRHIAIIRHPISRFISAWLNICSDKRFPGCFGCKADLSCFILSNYWHIRRHSHGMRPDKWYREWHFYPQSWYCDFEKHISSYHLLQYGRGAAFVDPLMTVMQEQNVPTYMLHTIETTLTNKSTAHETYTRQESVLDLLHAQPMLLDVLLKTYYTDFRMFNFSHIPLQGQMTA